MTNMKPAVIGTLLIVGLGVGFGGGYFFRNYQLTKMRGNFTMQGAAGNPQRFNGANRGNIQMGGQNGGFRGGAIQGTVLAQDSESVTVKLADGSSKIVLFSDSTTYSNTIKSTSADLKTGTEVSVFGTANSDGSVTAASIQLNPINFKQIDLVAPSTN